MSRLLRSRSLVAAPLLTLPVALTAQATTRPDPQTDSAGVTLRTVEIRGSATGPGNTVAANALTRADLHLRSPGTTPLKAAERLPGVNFNSSDPFGAYEWSFAEAGLIALGTDGKATAWLAMPWGAGASAAVVIADSAPPATRDRVRAVLDRVGVDRRTALK